VIDDIEDRLTRTSRTFCFQSRDARARSGTGPGQYPRKIGPKKREIN
jgi:hypothetical protein